MAAAVRPGITTAELAFVGSKRPCRTRRSHLPRLIVYDFPGDVCISVNDEVVHGIPGDRVLQPGDLVKLDLTAEKDGYHTDSAVTVQVAPTASMNLSNYPLRRARFPPIPGRRSSRQSHP